MWNIPIWSFYVLNVEKKRISTEWLANLIWNEQRENVNFVLFWIYVRNRIQLDYLFVRALLAVDNMWVRFFKKTIQSKLDEANVDLSHWWHLLYPMLRALSKLAGAVNQICRVVVSSLSSAYANIQY